MNNLRWWEKYQVDWPEARLGRWAIQKFEVNAEDANWHAMQSMFAGTYHRSVPEGAYTRLVRYPIVKMVQSQVVVMSDTPAEIRDHLDFIRAATGRVLIHGLGLGVCLKAVLAKEEVEHVDVVEASDEVIRLISPHFNEDAEAGRLTVHHANCFLKPWRPGTTWDAVWHDIWDNISLDNKDQYTRLNRSFGRRARWQGAWAQDELEYMKRQGR